MKMFVITIILLLEFSTRVRADTCPVPYTSIDPSVSSNVSFDKMTGNYIYSYEIQNGSSALIGIRAFKPVLVQVPSSILSPIHWHSDFVAVTPPFELEWSSLPSKRWAEPLIDPGKLLSGFSFHSLQPPGAIQYTAEGRTGIPESSPPEPGAADDEPDPNCPGWDFDNPRFQTLVTGLTTGPLAPNTISVPIRFRGEGGKNPRWPVNPNADKGKVSVIVLSTRDFDAGRIDLSTIKFGPGKAAPVSTKVTARRPEDDNPSEREDWEKQVLLLHGEDSRKTTRSNLLLTFDLAALQIRCVLDKALFLTAKTSDGKNVFGGVSTKLSGCDAKHPDIRPKPEPGPLRPKVIRHWHGLTIPSRKN